VVWSVYCHTIATVLFTLLWDLDGSGTYCQSIVTLMSLQHPLLCRTHRYYCTMDMVLSHIVIVWSWHCHSSAPAWLIHLYATICLWWYCHGTIPFVMLLSCCPQVKCSYYDCTFPILSWYCQVSLQNCHGFMKWIPSIVIVLWSRISVLSLS
jgi:hypothetical protein